MVTLQPSDAGERTIERKGYHDAPTSVSAPPVAKRSSADVVTGPQHPKKPSFPPPDVAPPSPRAAATSDGHWTPFGDARAADGAPLVVTTLIHPHAESAFVCDRRRDIAASLVEVEHSARGFNTELVRLDVRE